MRGGIIIILISKKEKDYMLSVGCRYHTDIFKTIGCSGGKYYLKESPNLIRKLEHYRESIKEKLEEKQSI